METVAYYNISGSFFVLSLRSYDFMHLIVETETD